MIPPGNEQRPAGKRSVIGSPTKQITRHRTRGVYDPGRRDRCPLACHECEFSTCPGLLDLAPVLDVLLGMREAA